MTELKNSGLPLYLDSSNNVMAISALLQYDSYARKLAGEMKGLLANEEGMDEKEAFYDVYRGIAYPEHQALLEQNEYRYDITIIMPGQINGECKKTSGHYHGYNPQRTNTYAEVYEVIQGTAVYIMQRADNFDTAPANVKVDDIIIATVEAGQSIIIPPNYGHCSINAGEGPMVFSNLAYVPCPIAYEPVRNYQGMSYYVQRENRQLSYQENQRYTHLPKPKFAQLKENPRLGIQFGLPVYQSFARNPQAFEFLKNPDPYVGDIMAMLAY